MPNKTYAWAASAVLLGTLNACATPGPKPGANGSDRSATSWCLGDRPISYEPADYAGQDDPGNVFDSEATVAEIQAHNARLSAACAPSD